MSDIDQISDDLLREIMQMEHEINKILALNGNNENQSTLQYRQLIAAKQEKLRILNDNYRDITDWAFYGLNSNNFYTLLTWPVLFYVF